MNPPVDAPASRARRPRTSTAKRVERGGQLLAAAGDEAGWLAAQLDRLAGAHQPGRGLGGAPTDADASGDDRLDRLTAAPEQPPAHELGIESPAHCHRRRI